MATSHYFPLYYGGVKGEQNLYQDLVDEQIKLFGTDIYYLPRILLRDNTLDDIIYSKFESQFQIEMMLVNVEGFGDTSEFISKFGVRITDEIKFMVSSRRWDQAVIDYNANLTVDGRPNEGDLLYFPLTKDLYEIKFVEREYPFYQFGKIQFYVLTAEIYEMGEDKIETGVEDIDEFEDMYSSSISLSMDEGGIGNFILGETVTNSITEDTAEVKSWNRITRILELVNRKGNFSEEDVIIGSQSAAEWTVGSFDTLNNTNTEYDMNRQIENEADNLIDWGERNPFGEYGNFDGSI